LTANVTLSRISRPVDHQDDAEPDAPLDVTADPAAAPRLSPAWLTEALRPGGASDPGELARVTSVRATRLGLDLGLLGTLHRVDLTWTGGHGQPSVVVKRPATGDQSRSVAVALDMYRNEVRFYRDLAGATELAVRCHHTALDEATHDFTLVLDDLSCATVVDQIGGASPVQAAAVVTALADHHARFWDESGLEAAVWLRPLDNPPFVEQLAAATRVTWPAVRARHGSRLDPAMLALGDHLADLVPTLAAELSRPPRTLVHGDARLDNVFLEADGRVSMCDWQLTDRSRGMRDVGMFVTQSLTPAVRARCERSLVDAYVRRLAERGVEGYDDEAWRDYRLAAVFSLIYAVVAGGGLDHAGPRSSALTAAMLDRSAAAIADNDAASLLCAGWG
jgi:Phosphotransferase enzyme family